MFYRHLRGAFVGLVYPRGVCMVFPTHSSVAKIQIFNEKTRNRYFQPFELATLKIQKVVKIVNYSPLYNLYWMQCDHFQYLENLYPHFW